MFHSPKNFNCKTDGNKCKGGLRTTRIAIFWETKYSWSLGKTYPIERIGLQYLQNLIQSSINLNKSIIAIGALEIYPVHIIWEIRKTYFSNLPMYLFILLTN